MKKYLSIVSKCLVLLSTIFFTNSCVKDTCKHTFSYTLYLPVYKTTTEVRANIKSNPAKDMQQPGKIVLVGNYIFLNEIDKGIHIIDNSNPSSPKNIAFIDIPGNEDLAVKGNTLYADLYTDLVTLDVSDPLHATVKKYNEGVFPDRIYNNGFYPDSSKVIVGWTQRDTTVTQDCNSNGILYFTPGIALAAYSSLSSQNSLPSPVGQGGSMARFALVNNYLYTVGSTDLSVFNIANGDDPLFSNKIPVDWHVETIYPFKNKLFVGANNGMYIYDINSSPSNPQKVGEFTHARSCDPVVADDNYAYVTLHSGTTCLGYNNELDVVKLNNLVNSDLVKTYSLTSPLGLSKDGNLLFICDGTDGLKIYDASDVLNLQLIKQFPGLDTYDVIAWNKIAIVVAKDGLYQYDYSNPGNIHLLSKLNIVN
jgi:hypothetical protein